eukprot:823421-Prymnesium_polylepis.1
MCLTHARRRRGRRSDWHTTMWRDVGGFRLGAQVEVDAWWVGPMDADGRPLGFPPVHTHHAHVRTAACNEDAAHAERQRGRVGAGCEGAPIGLAFEAHADSNCNGPNGTRCFLRALPRTAAVRIGGPLRFDAQLNDVRQPGAPPLRMHMEVAFRYHPLEAAETAAAAGPRGRSRAAMLTIGNPWPGDEDGATGRLRLNLAHGRKSVPTLFYFGATLGLGAYARAQLPLAHAARRSGPRG